MPKITTYNRLMNKVKEKEESQEAMKSVEFEEATFNEMLKAEKQKYEEYIDIITANTSASNKSNSSLSHDEFGNPQIQTVPNLSDKKRHKPGLLGRQINVIERMSIMLRRKKYRRQVGGRRHRLYSDKVTSIDSTEFSTSHSDTAPKIPPLISTEDGSVSRSLGSDRNRRIPAMIG